MSDSYANLIPSYPPINEPISIANLKEFSSVKTPRFYIKGGKPFVFQYLNARYFSLNTPFTNGLLFHEMGSGKTCSAAFIIENFVQQYNILANNYVDVGEIIDELGWFGNEYIRSSSSRRLSTRSPGSHIIVVTIVALHDQFRRQIAEKCTNLAKSVREASDSDIEDHTLDLRIRAAVRKTYTLLSPSDFIKKYKNSPEDLDGSCIFLDEVHSIRSGKAKLYERMLEIFENCTPRMLLGATGTPIWDTVSEFAQVANLCSGKQIFDPRTFKSTFFNTTLDEVPLDEASSSVAVEWKEGARERFESILSKNLSISYIRSNIPFERMKNMTSGIPSPNDQLSLFNVEAGSEQRRVLSEVGDDTLSGISPDEVSIQFSQVLQDAVNFVPPSSRKEEGVDRDLRQILIDSEVDPETGVPLALKEMSGKYFEWCRVLLLTPQFNSFTANRFKDTIGGVKEMGRVLGLVSEIISSRSGRLNPLNHGSAENPKIEIVRDVEFSSFSASNVSSSSRRVRKFVVLHGTTSDVQIQKFSDKFSSYGNRYGDWCSGIIASDKFFVGYSFLNVRNIFIITSWYNMSKIDQAKYRGIRSDSHKHFDPDIDDTNFYIYTFQTVGTFEVRVYEIALEKDILSQKIYSVLREIAWDCVANIERNSLSSELIDGSRECMYEDCEYTCTTPGGERIDYSSRRSRDANFLLLYENDFTKEELYDPLLDKDEGIRLGKICISIINRMFSPGEKLSIRKVVDEILLLISGTEGTEDSVSESSILLILTKLISQNAYVFSRIGVKYFMSYASPTAEYIQFSGGVEKSFAPSFCTFTKNQELVAVDSFLSGECRLNDLAEYFVRTGITSTFILLMNNLLRKVFFSSRGASVKALEFLIKVKNLLHLRVFVETPDNKIKKVDFATVNSIKKSKSVTIYHTLEIFRRRGSVHDKSPDYKEKRELITFISKKRFGQLSAQSKIYKTIRDIVDDHNKSLLSNNLRMNPTRENGDIYINHIVNWYKKETYPDHIEKLLEENEEMIIERVEDFTEEVKCGKILPSIRGEELEDWIAKKFTKPSRANCVNITNVEEIYIHLIRLLQFFEEGLEIIIQELKIPLTSPKNENRWLEMFSSFVKKVEKQPSNVIVDAILERICDRGKVKLRNGLYGFIDDEGIPQIININLEVISILRKIERSDAAGSSSGDNPKTILALVALLLYSATAGKAREKSEVSKLLERINGGGVLPLKKQTKRVLCELIYSLYTRLETEGLI